MIWAGIGKWVVRCVGSPVIEIPGLVCGILRSMFRCPGESLRAISESPGGILSLGKNCLWPWGICVGHGENCLCARGNILSGMERRSAERGFEGAEMEKRGEIMEQKGIIDGE